MDDHRVDAAQRGGQLRERQGVDERLAGGAPAGDLEGEHPAGRARAELALRRRRAAGGWEARIEDAVDAVLALEPGGECRGVPARAARRGRRGSGCRAGRGRPRAGRASRRSRSGRARPRRCAPPTGDDAGDQVAVAAEELRRRFDDQVRARARAGGRRTGWRTCCRRRTWRRGDGRARRAPRGR